MIHLESPAVRAVIAILIGLPGTVVLGWLALFQASFAAFGIPLSAWEAWGGHLRPDYVAKQLGWAVLALIWGLGGLAGIAGFWSWVLSTRPMTLRKRRWLIWLLSIGAACAIPVAYLWPGVLAWLAIAGSITAGVLVANLCFLTFRSSGP